MNPISTMSSVAKTTRETAITYTRKIDRYGGKKFVFDSIVHLVARAVCIYFVTEG